MSSVSPVLSASQLATLACLGEERTAAAGDVLYEVGAERYPFIAILEGEAAILDTAGDEIVRHGASSSRPTPSVLICVMFSPSSTSTRGSS